MRSTILILFVVLAAAAGARAQTGALILNEYNAVSDVNFLTLDAAAPYKGYDSQFGHVQGNGGNWVELVVVQDRLDIRNWSLQWSNTDPDQGSVTFKDTPLWSNLRAGTIITIREDDLSPPGVGVMLTDTSFKPSNNDWWIHINVDDLNYVDQQGFKTDNDNWQATIKNAAGVPVFGPIGESVAGWGGGGINSQESAANVNNPAATNTNADFDDQDYSTFGAPNRFNANTQEQDFSSLRYWFTRPDRIPGDVNLDRMVDLRDLTIMAVNWKTGGHDWMEGDITGDGLVDASDLAQLALNWQVAIAGAPFDDAALQVGLIPEPATLSLVLVSLLGLAPRRRRE